MGSGLRDLTLVTIWKSITVKPYIVGEGLQSMIIKKGQVITFDIKYGGEPEPTVKWMKGEEVNKNFHFLLHVENINEPEYYIILCYYIFKIQFK